METNIYYWDGTQWRLIFILGLGWDPIEINIYIGLGPNRDYYSEITRETTTTLPYAANVDRTTSLISRDVFFSLTKETFSPRRLSSW